MKYVCLVYLDESIFAPMSDYERGLFVNEALDSDEALRRGGNFVYANALQLPEAAVSVRVRDNKLSATDGPFAETKEHLSGLIVIEARDLNEAIRLAGNIPMARLGTIEVRPVRELERMEIGDKQV
ncbi:YciI family protein [Mesorhizobium sp. BAC0120]|uniref:YciI family protein n=1 Tax=Mesorhizobium sp. BAC0120 TaxID=3090670 RepID=UPI00298CE394|nr:YciI family protein [Mesorhizobium sp. BAC0120]MDW6021359.1 YciI family protein [Mesorhizobium sp. BAC0120]